jgi:hypothetical protein
MKRAVIDAQLDEARSARAIVMTALRQIGERIRALEDQRTAAEGERRPSARMSTFRPVIEPDELLGTWSIGLMADAEIQIPHGPDGSRIIQRIQSPGLWGIDGDAEPAYRAQVYADELAILEQMLAALNVEIIDDLETEQTPE